MMVVMMMLLGEMLERRLERELGKYKHSTQDLVECENRCY